MSESTLAFVLIAVVVVVTPGPDMLLVLRNTLVGGRRAGLATTAGVITGILGWGLLAVVGIAALLAASATAYVAVKLAGAAYLIYLGIATLRSSDVQYAEKGAPAAASVRAAAAQGLLSAALNPKLGVFFVTLLPQFADPAAGPWRSLELALVFAAIGLVWLIIFTALVDSLGDVLARPSIRRAIRRLSAAVFVGLGLRVATERA